MTRLIAGTILAVMSSPLSAQWLNYPTPGIPRTPDGKPNLSAPAPRTADGKPDLSGLWRKISPKYLGNIAADLKTGEVRPWAEALYQQRRDSLAKDSMSVLCLPLGPAYNTGNGGENPTAKVIQTPGLLAILNNDLTYRQVFLDGRELPKDPNPAWMGYSVGRWEGDTLVVESAGFNDRTWLDTSGHPHTEDLRVTERYRRRDFGHMELRVTLDDPKAYEKPWTVAVEMELEPDSELLEYVCNENEKDRGHLVGKASDDKKNEVKVAPEILAKYAGSYEMQGPNRISRIEITVSGDALFFDFDGRGKQQLIALSETSFSGFQGGLRFVKDDQGFVTHFLVQFAEGENKGVRKR